MSKGAKAALKEKHQSPRGEKSSSALPVQRRVARYAPVASNSKLLAFIHFISDHGFKKGSIDIYRCPRNQLHWLVRRGDESCSYTCALRVLTEIVSTVFDEYKISLKKMEGIPIVPYPSIQSSQYFKYNGPPTLPTLGINNSDLQEIMEEDAGTHSNMIDSSSDLYDNPHSTLLNGENEKGADRCHNTTDSIELPLLEDTPVIGSIISDMQKMTKDEITLFMDGETHYLRQVMRIVLDNAVNFSVLKSGGSSSGFQQLLDGIRGFMALRKRLTGASFWNLLELSDSNLPKNALTAAFGPLLKDMEASSRRTYMAYFSMVEAEVQKIWTPTMLSEGIKFVGIDEFNQEFILNKCPGFETHFTAEDKKEIYRRLPALVQECIAYACAPDEIIYKHLGDIVGPPSRGLPQTSFRTENQWADNEENNRRRPLLTEPSLNPPDRPVPKNAIPVSALDFSRHRGCILTSDSIKAGLAVQASYKAGLLQEKELKRQAQLQIQNDGKITEKS